MLRAMCRVAQMNLLQKFTYTLDEWSAPEVARWVSK